MDRVARFPSKARSYNGGCSDFSIRNLKTEAPWISPHAKKTRC
jgi:hypothetical protein